jgi:sugar lactone lactonase YvrE
MRTFDAEPIGDERYEIGEGPVWDAVLQVVRWVDIPTAMVFAGMVGPAGLVVVDRLTVDASDAVSCVIPTSDGGLLLAGRTELITVDADGTQVRGPAIEGLGPESRLNDGKVDPQGRLVVGSLAPRSHRGGERLLRIELDGTLRTLRTGLTCSNGIGWSPDGRTIYHVDSVDEEVRAFAYSPDTVDLGEGSVIVGGVPGPDGLCVDSEGAIWVAFWGAGEVRRFSPDGKPTARVRLPVPNPTSVAFIGPELDRLLITTAWSGLDAAALAGAPHSGRLFTCDVGVRGLPSVPWAGSAVRPPWGRRDP